jgi:hypothetical protein
MYWQEPTQTAVTPTRSPPNPNPLAPTYATAKLMLFGGQDHQTYLGCLNSSEFASDSIFNEFGRNGSEFSSTSIWNQFGKYGSEFSTYSPWNEFALDPPVIVNQNGNFFGRFTVNKFHRQRTRIPDIVQFLDSCEGLAADKIFERVHRHF